MVSSLSAMLLTSINAFSRQVGKELVHKFQSLKSHKTQALNVNDKLLGMSVK
jgi:hypothetical protein